MRPLFLSSLSRNHVPHRRTRLSVALWAAFAAGAVPAFLAPQAGAQVSDVDCTNSTTSPCIEKGKAEIAGGDYGTVYGIFKPSSGGGDATGGVVTMSNGKVTNLYGGRSNYGSATGNAVTISNGEVQGWVYGGWSAHRDAVSTGNAVTISGGKVSGSVVGGRSSLGVARGDSLDKGNTVTIEGSAVVTGSVYGGESGNSSNAATGNNSVHIDNGSVGVDVYGGKSNRSDADKNAVTMYGGQVKGNLYGGWGQQNTTGNSVEVSDGTVEKNIFGGRSENGTATDNSVTIIRNGKITNKATVYGGYSSTGNATGNSVTIKDGGYATDKATTVYGGYSNTGNATGNTIFLDSMETAVSAVTVYGGYSENGAATDNTIILGGDFNAGGWSNVFLNGGGDQKGSGNTLKVEGRNLTVASIQGFEKYEFNALCANCTALLLYQQDDAITLNSDSLLIHPSGLGIGQKATLLKKAGVSTASLSGSGTFTAKLDNDPNGLPAVEYTLENDNAHTQVDIIFYGLYLYGSPQDGSPGAGGQRAANNALTLSGQHATAAFAGRALTGDVTDNTLTIDGAATLQTQAGNALSGNAYGGYADTGNATGNTVILSNNMTGKTANFGIYGGASGSGGTVSGNTLQVQGNNIKANSIQNFENYVFDSAKFSTATPMLSLAGQSASVPIETGKVRILGAGFTAGENYTLLHDAAGKLDIQNVGEVATRLNDEPTGLPVDVFSTAASTAQDLVIAHAGSYLYGDGGTNNSPGQREQGNSLTLDNQTALAAFAGRALTGDVNGNTLTIDGAATLQTQTGSALSGNAYGGYADAGSATGNTVILSDKMSGKTAGFGIYGGNTGASGNTLEVQGNGITVSSINNFENLNFILPAATAAGAAMLEVTGGAATVFAQMTNIGVAIAGGGSVLKMGDQVTLLTNAAGLEGSSGTLQQGTDYQQVNLTGRQGISLEYDFTLSNTDRTIDATVSRFQPVQPPKPTPQPQPDPKPQPTPPQPVPPQPTPPGPQVNPQTKAIPEGRVAGMGMLNLGSDQIVRMTGNLPNRTGGGAPNFGGSDNKGEPNDTTAFARLSGYDQKVMTGSHVKVNGATAIVGAAKVVPLAGGGTAAVGAFFEYGDGSFKTHNGFDTGDVNGKGNSDYYGAGVMAKATLAGSGNGAPFVEGSVHAGRIHNNWHTDDLRDAATGARAQYDIRTPYMGGHVGAGYRWQTGAASHVEAYGQYLYTHMDGKDTTVALDPYHFNAVKSSRTRLGAKGTWAVSQQTQAYAGAAWEREFDGTARATAYSFDVPAPTMKGNSAVLDAGLSFQPKRNLSTNVGVTGYAGKRKGASANVEVQYLF